MPSKMLDTFAGGEAIWTGDVAYGTGRFPDGSVGALIAGTAASERLAADWRGARSLQFMVYNPLAEAVVGGIELYDAAALASPNREYGDFVDLRRSLLFGEGVTFVIIRIDPIRTARGDRLLDLANLARVTLRMPERRPDGEALAVSSLLLSDKAEEPDDSLQPQPGDTIAFIHHLDISCYTYRPEQYLEPDDVLALERAVVREKGRLTDTIAVAQTNGKSARYAQAALLAADIALKGRPLLAWHFGPAAKRRSLTGALRELECHRGELEALLSSRKHEDDEDDSNVSPSAVKPLPALRSLTVRGDAFVDAAGTPQLVCAMSYHNEGALLDFFAPEQHKAEIYAVGGGSRYDIERSPVYEAFHRYPGTARVGWQGWCGHLIKDQWAMGGRKENVVICLENERILEAIDRYNEEHLDDWRHLPHLMYAILGYELSYMCYCDKSIARFRDWLAERHGSVEALNAAWGTLYASFAEAVPPPADGGAPAADANRAAWFDWADWNTRRFTDHLLKVKRGIRRSEPDLPLCAGGTSSMQSAGNGTTGIDEEQIINEVDDVILHEGNDLLGIDLFRALSETPKPIVDPEQGGDCSRWLLNYLHGKSAISKFWWPKQPSRQFPTSTLMSPAHGNASIAEVAEHLYTALDVRRLHKEITAFWTMTREVAILYSKTNVVQVPPELMKGDSTPYLDALRDAYEAARCLDAGITFISEKQLRRDEARSFKLIVLPAAKHLPQAAFAALDRYVRSGGHVLVLPESLTRDEYDRPQPYLAQWGFRVDRTIAPQVAGLGEPVQRYDQSLAQEVRYEPGAIVEAASVHPAFASVRVRAAGLRQHVTAPDAEVLAADSGGSPLLLKRRLDSGTIWYAAATLQRSVLGGILDVLFAEAGVQRPLNVTDPEGNRIEGLEARLVRRRHDDLVYVANESGRPVRFALHTDRPVHRIRELRSLQYWQRPEGDIRDRETLLLSLMEDPAIRFGHPVI